MTRYKFDIIEESDVSFKENMPKYFLADTPEKAKKIYEEYENMLNSIAYKYASYTGLSRADLFGEGLIGLSKAVRDWDSSKASLKTYAQYKIEDEIGEFIRKNSTAVVIPSYIKKANNNLMKIRRICEKHNINWEVVVFDQYLPEILEVEEAILCEKYVVNIIRASERAGVLYEEFINRILLIPQSINLSEQDQFPHDSQREQEQLEAFLVVDKLKQYMSDEEKIICNGIMEDKSYELIGKEMGKSKAWVSGRFEKLKLRIIEKILGES